MSLPFGRNKLPNGIRTRPAGPKKKGGTTMSEVHLPHQHSDEGTMRELQESVETIGSFQTVADVFKQLSDSSRVRIFWLLCHCEECVIDLSAMVGMSSPAVSHHLRQLRESGLLVSRRVGKEVYYRAAENEQAQLLHRMIERTMEISCPEEESRAGHRARRTCPRSTPRCTRAAARVSRSRPSAPCTTI